MRRGDAIQRTKSYVVEVYLHAFFEWVPVANFGTGGYDDAVEYYEYLWDKDSVSELRVVEYETVTTTTCKVLEGEK